MRNAKREVECLERLRSTSAVIDDLLEFLKHERFITQEELKAIRSSPELTKLLQQRLARLADLDKDGRIQLLEYVWTILPHERIFITIVTNDQHKEFSMEV